MPKDSIRLSLAGSGAQLRCGFKKFPAGSEERAFVTAELALVLMLSGSGEHECEGRKQGFKAGDVFRRPPGIPHSVRFFEDCEAAYLAVPAGVQGLLEGALPGGFKAGVFRSEAPREEAKERFKRMIETLERTPSGRLFEALAEMQRLIAFLLFSKEPEPLTARACRLLEKGIETGESLESVAKSLKMSYSLFRKRFAEEIGVPPGRYQQKRRMETAYKLLEAGELQVGEIAAKLGYPDIYSFSRQFKRLSGQSPSQARAGARLKPRRAARAS